MMYKWNMWGDIVFVFVREVPMKKDIDQYNVQDNTSKLSGMIKENYVYDILLLFLDNV